MINDELATSTILGFMEARCDVTSQHKLPWLGEILETHIADFIGKERTESIIADLISQGRLIEYGPYLSDRKIDVL